MAPVTVERMLGANSAALEQHARGVEVSCEARIVKSHRIPLVARVDIDTRLQQVPESINVAGTGGLENVAVGDLLERDGGSEIRRVEVDSVEVRVDSPGVALRGHLVGVGPLVLGLGFVVGLSLLSGLWLHGCLGTVSTNILRGFIVFFFLYLYLFSCYLDQQKDIILSFSFLKY